MGIYDRDYIRRDGPQGGRPRSPIPAMGMWSITTWLIVICVAVFVVDGFFPPKTWRPVEVAREVPPGVSLDPTGRYRALPNSDPGEAQGALIYKRTVVDAQEGQTVGVLTYLRMSPIQYWLHFSTEKGFFQFQLWRLIGFQFLHANLTHILFNMLGLFFFGPMVEQYLGRKRFLAFYLLCGMFGALLYLGLNLAGFVSSEVFGASTNSIPFLLFDSPSAPLIGASAGVYGVIMAGAFLAPKATVYLFFILPMRLATLAYGIVIIALLTLIMRGNNYGGEVGHLGGALAGFYFIRHPRHLHGFFDIIGKADPTSHHYRGGSSRAQPKDARQQEKIDREIDRILDKIKNGGGTQALTAKEKKILREASRSDR